MLLGRKSVQTEIWINATPKQVWEQITNLNQYSDWNSVMIPLDGDLHVGRVILYQFNQDQKKSYEVSATVKKVLSEKWLNQCGGVPGFMTFDHHYELIPKNMGVHLIVSETYQGLMVNFWNPEPVKQAYQRMVLDLKRYIEENNQ